MTNFIPSRLFALLEFPIVAVQNIHHFILVQSSALVHAVTFPRPVGGRELLLSSAAGLPLHEGGVEVSAPAGKVSTAPHPWASRHHAHPCRQTSKET